MKKLLYSLTSLIGFFMFVPPVFAVGPDIKNYTSDTLQSIILIGSALAGFFLVKGGYFYITSSGNPDNLESAKRTIRNALIGLVLILSAGFIVTLLQNTFTSQTTPNNLSSVSLTPIAPQVPTDGVGSVMINGINAIMQNVIQSATKPLLDAIISYLTTTPSLLSNAVVFNFWLVILGIVDTLFVLVIAVLGLHVMSASSFGFEEIELKHLLPRIGLAFLGANVSLFLCDYVITTCNALVSEVLHSTGGLDHAWVVNAATFENLLDNNAETITLLFLLLFIIIAIILLIMYIVRLIMIVLAGVMAPFIFLLWAIPKFSDFAQAAIRGYLVTVFIIFVHVVVIQLAASFLALPDHTNNSILAVVIAIGLFLTLLKIPTWLFQMMFYTSRIGSLKHMGGQMLNVMTTHKTDEKTMNSQSVIGVDAEIQKRRRYINA